MSNFAFPARIVLAVFVAIGIVAFYPGSASAAPTAEFTYGPDEFVVGTSHYDDPSSQVAYHAWAGSNSSSASAGTYRRDAKGNATTTLTFSGTSVTWLTATGPDHGRAAISIDGRSPVTVDNYSPLRTWKVPRTYGGLTGGLHTITVTVLGDRNPSSTGASIISDAFTAQ